MNKLIPGMDLLQRKVDFRGDVRIRGPGRLSHENLRERTVRQVEARYCSRGKWGTQFKLITFACEYVRGHRTT